MKRLSLSSTIIWMLFVIPSCVLSVYEPHIKCATKFECSNQRELYYPFWTPEREECGHPYFKVNCSGDFPEFNVSSVKFQILGMNYYDGFIRLARVDYRNNLCPQHPENTTINQQILPFLQDTELRTFYYNCSGPKVDVLPSGYIRELECEKDIGKHSYFVSSPSHSGNRAILYGLSASCQRIVNIPVSSSALSIEDGNQSLEPIKKALDEGFKLRFNSNCSGCETSWGACGQNKSTRAFVCYCVDGPHNQTCQSNIGKKRKIFKNAKIGIGFACGLLGATLFIGFLLCFIQRRKKLAGQYTSKGLSTTLPYSSNTISNTTTSNHPRDHDLKALIQLKQYSYAEVKQITKSFSHTVGKGGFGTVYGGNLCNGRKVAVKILKDFKSNGEDFINEVASMSDM